MEFGDCRKRFPNILFVLSFCLQVLKWAMRDGKEFASFNIYRPGLIPLGNNSNLFGLIYANEFGIQPMTPRIGKQMCTESNINSSGFLVNLVRSAVQVVNYRPIRICHVEEVIFSPVLFDELYNP